MDNSEIFAGWLAALEARHLSDLRVPEVTKALRALSSTYVERRRKAVPRAMESAGKRAAFALFYAPLHFLATSLVVRALEADVPAPRAILDIGCGTGAAGAAWGVGRRPNAACRRYRSSSVGGQGGEVDLPPAWARRTRAPGGRRAAAAARAGQGGGGGLCTE